MPPHTSKEKSRIDRGYERGLNEGGSAYASAGIDQLEAHANNPRNKDVNSAKDVSEAEQTPNQPSDGDWAYSGSPKQQRQQQKFTGAVNFMKRRGGIMGAIIAVLIGGGIMAGFFGPASMLINLYENATFTNDSSSVAMERRFMKVLTNMTGEQDEICKSTTKKMRCSVGRISNKALNQLYKKGVIADGYDGTTRRGYPAANPTGYTFDDGRGNTQYVLAKDVREFLTKKENARFAAMVLGKRGAFNMRVKAWGGRFIHNSLYAKFNLNESRKKGGHADGSHEEGTKEERSQKLRDRIKQNIPGASAISQASDRVKDKVRKQGNKAKKGGAAYVSMVMGCVAVRAPGYVATAVAAVQLAQIMPYAMDFILSPGSKQKASGVEVLNSVTPNDIDTVNTALTEQTMDEEGNMTSALDSAILMSAIGVNTGRPAVSDTFSPGRAIFANNIVKKANAVADASDEACNTILSPTMMYTMFAVDSAITVAASATIIGGLVKIVGSWVASTIFIQVGTMIAGNIAEDMIADLANSEAVPNARGKELGDVIGLSVMSTFSAGGMARHMPAMAESQLVAYDYIRQENESFYRDMEIASHSPFDTSSRYTFMGSIRHSLQMAALTSGNNPLSILGSVFRAPSFATAGAATGFSTNYCSYAKDFQAATDNPATTPALNAAGLPCTGITPIQAAMDTDMAIDILEGEGWLDDSVDIEETDLIDDLMPSVSEDGYNGKGYIKADTPLYEFINSCSKAETGDYLINSSGCIVHNVGADGSIADVCGGTITDSEGNTTEACTNTLDLEGDTELVDTSIGHPQALQAMSVFLLDYQIVRSINGEDDEDAAPAQPASTGGEGSGVVGGDGWAYPTTPDGIITSGYKVPGRPDHMGVDIAHNGGALNKPIYAVYDGVVTRSGPAGGFGNWIVIEHNVNGQKIDSVYGHMYDDGLLVKVGDTVTAGQHIGKIGSNGQSTGPHLHFELWNGGRFGGSEIDPTPIINAAKGS